MIASLRQLLRPREAPLPAAVPLGERVYAIGDIHGRLDLLAALAQAVEADDCQRNDLGDSLASLINTTVVLLGDLVDRGPDSAGVIAFARDWQKQRPLRILTGNHEEMLLASLDDVEVLRHLLRYGGEETLLSFGIDLHKFDEASFGEVQDMMREAIPEETLSFLRGFEDLVQIGDYAFVHAGIHPGTALDDQHIADLRWIREPFLSASCDHGAVIVHGHTIFEEPSITPNRIGIDTGAYASGRLTALGLEGTKRWLIEALEVEGAITTRSQPLD